MQFHLSVAPSSAITMSLCPECEGDMAALTLLHKASDITIELMIPDDNGSGDN